MIIVWGKFFVILFLINFFGKISTKSADIIAEKKGLGRAFMGVVFVSMITSLPELFSGLSSVTIIKSPDIAIGQIIGSCIFNILIIGLIELFFYKKNIYKKSSKQNILNMGFSIIIIAVLVILIATQFELKIMNIGVSSLIIFALYIFFMRVIFKDRKETKEVFQYKDKSLKKEIIKFALSAMAIIAIGLYLPIVGREIAIVMNWGDTLIGIIFIAFVTSFPELVVSFQAAKIGAFDMFIGNIAGSNLFNIAIILVLDIFYLKGNILTAISSKNITVGVIAILMNFIAFFAIIRKSESKIFKFLSLNSLALISLYIITIFVSA